MVGNEATVGCTLDDGCVGRLAGSVGGGGAEYGRCRERGEAGEGIRSPGRWVGGCLGARVNLATRARDAGRLAVAGRGAGRATRGGIAATGGEGDEEWGQGVGLGREPDWAGRGGRGRAAQQGKFPFFFSLKFAFELI